jgi:hypothetical protein
MAENPHSLEKDIKGTFNAFDLTGKAEGNIVDRIVQFKHDLPTGEGSHMHVYDKLIKSYFKQLDTLGLDGFQTDPIDAGFNPQTITGFFDNEVNTALFDFLSKDNQGYFYSMRKINPDYTGYACRVRRQFDNALGSVEFDSNGIVSPDSKVTILEGEEGFGLGFKGVETFAVDGRTGNLYDFFFPLTRYMAPSSPTPYDSHHYDGGVLNIYPQRMDSENITKSLTGQAETDSFKIQVGSLYNPTYDDDFSNVTFKLFSGARNGNAYGDAAHTHPIWSGEKAGQTFWFYKHHFGSASPYGLRWVLVKNSTPTINAPLDSSFSILRAYSENLNTTDRNRPYNDTTNWVFRDPGGINANDPTPRETVTYNKVVVDSPIIKYGVATSDKLPSLKRGDGGLAMLSDATHPSGTIATPLYGYYGVGGSQLYINGTHDIKSGSMIIVAKPLSVAGLGLAQIYCANSINIFSDNHAAVYVGDRTEGQHFANQPASTGYYMRFGNSSVSDYAFKGEIIAPSYVSGGDFGTGDFVQNPVSFNLIEMHNLATTDDTTGANEVFFNDVKAIYQDAFDGTSASVKETGNLGSFHFFGMSSFGSRPLIGGQIPEIIMFKSDPKNTEGERRRFIPAIKSFYHITGGKS